MAKYNKTKLFWIQIKDDWFDDDAIKWLETMPDGREFSLFYMKLCLKSLKLGGYVIQVVGKMYIPYDSEALAKLTNTPQEIVKNAMPFLQQAGLIEYTEENAIYIERVKDLISYTTIGAERKQIQRGGQMSAFCPPHIQLQLQLQQQDNICIPTKAEIDEYCLEIKKPMNTQKFLDFYQSKGWLVGNAPMVDWRACVRNWQDDTSKKKSMIENDKGEFFGMGVQI